MPKRILAIPLSRLVVDKRECPQCGRSRNNFRRKRRGLLERWVNRYVPCGKYKCWVCGWEGLIRTDEPED